MIVRYQTSSGVEWRRPVDSLADLDRELVACVALRRFHAGPAARHPGSTRALANYDGLLDELLDARWEWMRAEVDRCRTSWWGSMPTGQEVVSS